MPGVEQFIVLPVPRRQTWHSLYHSTQVGLLEPNFSINTSVAGLVVLDRIDRSPSATTEFD